MDRPEIPIPLHIAIVEDDENLLAHFGKVINAAPDMIVVASATSLEEGLAFIETQAQPADVLLVDIGLPDGSGLRLINEAKRRWPNCEIMVCTSFSDEGTVLDAIEMGASGYLLKEATAPQIVEEIRSLVSGGSPISPRIARQVLQRLRPGVPPPAPPKAEPLQHPLSSREIQVLEQIALGLTYEEIAGHIALSRFTVLTYVRRIYDKLSVNSKIEAINAARKHGLVD